jgi:hypothetical protein
MKSWSQLVGLEDEGLSQILQAFQNRPGLHIEFRLVLWRLAQGWVFQCICCRYPWSGLPICRHKGKRHPYHIAYHKQSIEIL